MTDNLFDHLVAEAEEVEVAADQKRIEEALLAGVFTTPEARDLILKVSPRDFYFDLHRQLAKAIWPALREGRHVDRVTLDAGLPIDDAKPDDRAALLGLADRVFDQADVDPPSLPKVAEYLKIFIDRAEVNLAKHLVSKIGDGLTAHKITPTEAGAKIAEVWSDLEVGRRLVGGLESEAKNWPDYFADLEASQAPGRDFTGLDTGFDHLNNVANGLTEGLVILGAAPSTGKTTFAKQLADQVAALNDRAAVLFVSLEQSAAELRVKTLSRLSGVENRDILRGRLDPASTAWGKVRTVAADYESQTAGRVFVLEGDKTTTPDRIRLHAMTIKREAMVDVVFVVIDYLQIVPTEEEYKDPRGRVDAVVSDLRRLARDLHCPVMAISSVGRVNYDNPSISSFKESGGIEYGADLGAVMARSKDKLAGYDMIDGVKRQWKRVSLDIVKNRNGERARIEYNFFPSISLFQEHNKSTLPEEDATG